MKGEKVAIQEISYRLMKVGMTVDADRLKVLF